MTTHARRRTDAGFTLLEMLVATAIMLVVTAGIFSLLDPARGTFQAQPEVSDMQQRLRVAADTIHKDLVMAGAGTYSGLAAGPLDNYFAPILPHRVGTINADPAGSFRASTACANCSSAVTIMYVPTTFAQTTIRSDMPNESAELKVEQQAGCPPDQGNLCGFKEGMRVLIFDPSGAYDIFTITNVQDQALHLQHRDDKFTTTYQAGAWITQIASHTYYLEEDQANATYRLRHYDGYLTDLPIVENVVDFRVEYFGDPLAPRIRKPLTDPIGPWTTYGPKAPPLGTDNSKDSWAAGENCVFRIDPNTGLQVSRLPDLGPASGGLVQMGAGMLTDGPWCPAEKSAEKNGAEMPNRFDADLLRVRQVRVTLRVQVANEVLRGPAGTLFRHGGTSRGGSRFVPDQEIRFDVSPRNMNLGR